MISTHYSWWWFILEVEALDRDMQFCHEWMWTAAKNAPYTSIYLYHGWVSVAADTLHEKTIFPKSWNIMKSSKIPRKYQLFPISEKFKTRTFPYSKNMVFHAEENIILHQLFEPKDDPISHLRKVQNKNFSLFRKHSIPR